MIYQSIQHQRNLPKFRTVRNLSMHTEKYGGKNKNRLILWFFLFR